MKTLERLKRGENVEKRAQNPFFLEVYIKQISLVISLSFLCLF